MNAPTDNFNADELRGEPPPTDAPTGTAVVANPFGTAKPLAVASAESDVARAVTEVQAGMLIARQFPRNELAAMDKILNAFARPGLAEKAVYQYARGGSDIVGPSIRAAEALAQLWGNIYTGVRELEQRGGASTVEAFAWDTETGFHDVKVFQVSHMRHTRSGSYKIEDPRDIYEHVANAAARRKRACILAVIPSDVIDSAMRQADLTMHTKAEATPERVNGMVAAFGQFGVSREAIEKKIQRRMDAITPAQIVQMGRIFNSLRDGMSTVGDWFEVDTTTPTPTGAPPTKAPKGTDGLKAARAKAQNDAPPPQTPPPGESTAQAPNVAPGPDMMPAPTLADVLVAIGKAADHDALDLVLDGARGFDEPQQKAEIDVAARARRKALGDR